MDAVLIKAFRKQETFWHAIYKFPQLLIYLNIFTIIRNITKMYQCSDPLHTIEKNKFAEQCMASK